VADGGDALELILEEGRVVEAKGLGASVSYRYTGHELTTVSGGADRTYREAEAPTEGTRPCVVASNLHRRASARLL
jgi:hypothetical protein